MLACAVLSTEVRDAGRKSWPHEGWTAEFVEGCVERLGESEAWRSHRNDLLLAWACILGQPAALTDFDRECVRDLAPNLLRMGLGKHECDDVLQETRDRLLVGGEGEPGLTAYRGLGPLGGFVRTVATRLALDFKRKQQRRREVGSEIPERLAATDHELEHVKTECSEYFRKAAAGAWSALSPAQQLLLRQHLGDQLGIVELGQIYGIHPATAARRAGTARQTLIRETKRRLREELGGGMATLSSVMRLLASRSELLSAFGLQDSRVSSYLSKLQQPGDAGPD